MLWPGGRPRRAGRGQSSVSAPHPTSGSRAIAPTVLAQGGRPGCRTPQEHLDDDDDVRAGEAEEVDHSTERSGPWGAPRRRRRRGTSRPRPGHVRLRQTPVLPAPAPPPKWGAPTEHCVTFLIVSALVKPEVDHSVGVPRGEDGEEQHVHDHATSASALTNPGAARAGAPRPTERWVTFLIGLKQIEGGPASRHRGGSRGAGAVEPGGGGL